MKSDKTLFEEGFMISMNAAAKLSPAELQKRRNFNTRERQALYILSGGICAICSTPLTDTWEPDHIVPWSAGGLTDVSNGQALCRTCNRKKGGAKNANS